MPITNRPSSPVTLIPKLQPHLLQQLLVALAFAPAAFAQSAPPTSGSQGQQIPQIPSLPRPAPNIGLPAPLAPAAAASAASAANQTSFPLQTLRLTGNRILGEAELLQASGFAPGSYTLAQLQVLAQKITAAYQARGYFVAQAYVPKQDIAGGVATIAVVEGQYGKIAVRNPTQLSPRVVNAIVSGLEKGDAVNVAPLERRLLALSDLPGISVKSTLAPGEEAGSSDLSIDIQDAQSITGSVDADNQGGRYTGAIRMGATVNLNNAAGLGDVASLRAFTSGSGLSYARASYQAPVGMGTLGVAYSSLGYKLGKEFAALQASGSARTTSLYGSYPLIRSRSRNLNLQLGLDTKTFQDKQDATASLIDKKSKVWTLSVSGDQRNSAGAGGITSYSLGTVAGRLDIQSAAALALDATSAKANGSYSKLLYSLTQQQNISEQTQLYASVFGQTASKNLDSSEKLGLGGANSVRAYPSGEAYGDQGYVLTLEARQTLPQASGPNGQLQAIGFIDTGSITVSKTPFVLTTPNSKRLSGWGLGVQWTGTNALIIKAYYARKLGSELATSAPDRSGRFWIQAVKYF